MLRRNVIFVDSARPIVKSDRHRTKNDGTRARVGVGMRQSDLASVVAFASHGNGSRVREASIGSRLLAGSIGAPEMAALTAFLPDFRIDRRLRDASADRLSGVVAWSGSRHQGREERIAAALGVPFLLLGWGLLRAAPRSRGAAPAPT